MTIIRGIKMENLRTFLYILALCVVSYVAGTKDSNPVELTRLNIDKQKLENQKTELEIKRLQYEIKLLEDQGIPVDVE